ncbi:hypothetical protein H632_c3199p0 [Helicosporidium sp. ATCC 50920]|nr:hypothetical protein H632_c3199p0 [Helicosporidium sp. ATCC 50920]|eukprot:KDD72551.1 hypothetical protein H632_c3199p0 [Helicosporidium sp. ATCC 50920]
MAESIRSTDTQIPEFWDIVDEVQGVVQGINGSLAGITSSANQLEPILDSTQGAIVPLLQGLADDPALQAQFPQFAPLANAQSIATIRQALSGASAHLQSVVAGLNSAENLVQNKILPTLQSAVDEVEPPTMAFQNRWRYIPIAVLFGVLIVLAALLALTLPRMRWYKTASALTAVAWLDIALVMLLGVGILRGIYEVSGDVCLYGETYVYDRTSAALDGDAQGVFQRAWWYYTGNGTLPEATYFDVITGTPVSQVLDTIEQPEVVELLLAISNITSAQLQAAGVQGPLAQDILQLPGLITPLAGDIADVLRYASLDTIQPIYVRVKGLLCCELGSRSYDVWVAWTAAGCVAFVFALLASARVVSHTVIAARKLQDQGLRGAELYPGDGAPPYGVYNPGDAPAWGMPGADGRPHGAMGKL